MSAVSFIIPSYNGLSLLARNIPKIVQAARTGDEILIIDDASTDETISWLVEKYGLLLKENTSDYLLYKRVITHQKKKILLTLISNEHNLRFAATCNRAARIATSSHIFLLNNDVEPDKNVIQQLLPHFDDPKVFAVGCHEIEQETESKSTISGGKNSLHFVRGMFVHNRATVFSTGDTAWASGGSAMFDRQKWLLLGGFSPSYYPAYWEDIDLSFRARLKGWKVMFDANAFVYHNHETTNASVFGHKTIEEMSWRNARTFAWKNGTILQRLLFLVWQPYWWLKMKRF